MANIELTWQEITDVKRALIIAMHELDSTKNDPDIVLSDRLEQINSRLDDFHNLTINK
jgi:hypothetical protein